MSIRDLFTSPPIPPKVESVVSDEIPERITGKINFLHERGWGFILSPEVKFERFFFHWSALEPDTLRFPELKKGMRVEFTPREFEDRKMRALKIRVVE